MPPHRTVIEAGPANVRRICCDEGATVEVEVAAAALAGIDDPVALVGGRPVSVETLWRDALRALACGPGEGMLVVHPSWWSAARVGVLSSAAQAVMKSAVMQPRSALLAQAAPEATVMVEIADRMVVVSGAEVVAVPEPQRRRLRRAVAVDDAHRDAAGHQLDDAEVPFAATRRQLQRLQQRAAVAEAHRQVITPRTPFARPSVEVTCSDFASHETDLSQVFCELCWSARGRIPVDARLLGFHEDQKSGIHRLRLCQLIGSEDKSDQHRQKLSSSE